jgi:hypothetical protein
MLSGTHGLDVYPFYLIIYNLSHTFIGIDYKTYISAHDILITLFYNSTLKYRSLLTIVISSTKDEGDNLKCKK